MNQSSKHQPQNNREKVISLIEQSITEKVKSMLKEEENEIDRKLLVQQDKVKEDEFAVQVKTKIHEVATDQTFKKVATSILACNNLNQQQKDEYARQFTTIQNFFIELDKPQGQLKIKVKVNKFIVELQKKTFELLDSLKDNLVRLSQAGFCGVGAQLRVFQSDYRKFEFIANQWMLIPQMENNNVEYQAFKPQFKEQEFRQFVTSTILKNFPENESIGTGEVRIVEKEKFIEVPKIQIVEKIINTEVPKYIEKIVERVIEKPVDRIVYKDREVIKEVIRQVPQADRVREAHEMLFGIGRPQNITEALNIYYEEAEVSGNPLACNAIAQIFYDGKYFPRDLNKAFHYYEKSASMNDQEGLYRVGLFLKKRFIDGYQFSQGRLSSRDKELEEAILFFQQAAEQGHLDALTDLGEIFEQGLYSQEQEDHIIIKPDFEQAEFYYQQGKKVRYPRAVCMLGQFYLNHPEYKEKILGDNARKAIKYFELARELGHAQASYYLAHCYEYGKGIFTNLEKAKALYKEGALRGNMECKVHYMFYVMQDATNSDKQEDYLYAYNYFRDIVSTNPDISETYFYLGHLYECGFGVNKDPQIAQNYYFKGAKLNSPACMNKLGDFYHSGFGVAKNQKEALKYYKMAAELKDPEALLNMGSIYEDGYEGVKPDFVMAFNCYEEASKLGNAKAYFNLGLMYETEFVIQGRYVSKNLNEAIELYKKAALMGCEAARNLLDKKKIPIIYDDSLNTAMISLDEEASLISQIENKDRRLMGVPRAQEPVITNPYIMNNGKKTNQNILQSKIEKQSQSDGRFQSILVTGMQKFKQENEELNEQ